MRGASLQQLHDLFDRHPRRQIDESVNVICVYMIDLHVDSLCFGVFAQVVGDARGSLFLKQPIAAESSPDQMQPAPRVGV